MSETKNKYLREEPIESFRQRLYRKINLTSLTLELTRRCTLDCRHCMVNRPAGDKTERAQEFTTQEWLQAISEAAELGCPAITITGGEPLLHPGFNEIYLHAVRQGIAVTVNSNASVIDQDHIKLFQEYPPADGLLVTIYGLSEEDYLRHTGHRGMFDTVRQNLLRVKRAGVNVRLRTYLSRYKPETEEKYLRFAREHVSSPRERIETPAYLQLRQYRDDEAKNRRIREERLEPEDWLDAATLYREEYYRQDLGAACRRMAGRHGDTLFHCGGVMRGGAVSAHGMFKPCLSLDDQALVRDLRKVTLGEAIVELRAGLPRLKGEHPRFKERCAVCFLRSFCHACPANNLAETGSLDEPADYFCRLTHASAEFIGVLKPGEKAWEVAQWRERIAGLPEEPPTTSSSTGTATEEQGDQHES